ncbi:MAG: hypothetical protein HY606_07410 [Planctomycetes bacterium]|nr:hypothetical protein [Planctomycetota bacterium]
MKTKLKPSRDGQKAEMALREAVADLIDESRKLGHSLVVMRNGKAVLIPASKLRKPRIRKNGSRSRS